MPLPGETTTPASEMVIEGNVTENQSAPDNSAALAEISSDLFGQGGDEDVDGDKATGGPESAPKEVAGPSEVDAASAPKDEENSAAVQETGAPKTWSKDAIADWATIPDRAKQEILKREEDMFRGLEQYRGAAEVGRAYDSVVEPYRQILTAEGVDPVQLFQSFAGNHYILARGTPEQKLGLAANLLSSYNIDLIQLADYIGNTVPTDPAIAALQAEIAELKKGQTQVQTRETEATRSRIEAEVEAFASDPKNVYFSELVDDISKLMASGAAASLQQAYDTAVYANPVTRGKEQARLTAEAKAAAEAEAKARGDKVARLTGADVTTMPKQRDGTVPIGSMDDTLEETLAAIRNKH